MSLAFRDRLALLAYRMRPLEPVTLVIALVVTCAVGVVMIPGAPPSEPLAPVDVTGPLTMVAMGLALTLGFVGGRDVDVAEPLLSSMPRPYRGALVLRVVLWSPVLVAVVAVLVERGAYALGGSAAPLRGHGLVLLSFAGAVTLVASRMLGSLPGGGAALGLIAAVAGIPFVYEGFPLDLLAPAGSGAWSTTAPRLELVAVALIVAAYWRARP